MIDGYVVVLCVASVVLLLAGLLSSASTRPPGLVHLGLATAIEIAVLGQIVIAVVGLVGGAEVGSVVLFLAYAAFCIVVLPLGALYAVEEKTRWSGLVLAVASLSLIVTLLRLSAVWVGADA